MVRYNLVFVYIFMLVGVANAQTDSGKGSKPPDTLTQQISRDTTHAVSNTDTIVQTENSVPPDSVHSNLAKDTVGQCNCATIVNNADIFYNNGNYDACLALLNTGFANCKLSKKEKEEADILSARVNIEIDRTEDVNKSLVKLLRLDPNFIPKEGAYQEDFYASFSNIKVRPFLSAGFFTGINLPFYKVLQTYSVYQGVNYSAPYNLVFGLQEGVYLECAFLSRLSLLASISYSSFGYKRELDDGTGDYILNYNENLSYINTPVYLKFYFTNTKFKLFAILGGSYSLLEQSTANLNLQYSASDYISGVSSTYTTGEGGINQKPYRVSSFTSMLFGGGCSYRFKNFIFALQASYAIENNNIMNPDENTRNQELEYKFYYIDNALSLSLLNINASVGYILKYQVKTKRK